MFIKEFREVQILKPADIILAAAPGGGVSDPYSLHARSVALLAKA